MRRVFVINKGSYDYSDAERFGELVFCSEGTVAKFNTSQMAKVFLEAFRESDPSDYILLTSLTTMCSIACAIFAHKHGKLNLLLFKDGTYTERIVKVYDN